MKRKPREVSLVASGHFEKGVFYVDKERKSLWLAVSKEILARIDNGVLQTKHPESKHKVVRGASVEDALGKWKTTPDVVDTLLAPFFRPDEAPKSSRVANPRSVERDEARGRARISRSRYGFGGDD